MYQVVLDVLKAKDDQNQPHLDNSSISNSMYTRRTYLYRGVTHQSITFGFGLRHIRVSHLVLGLHTLDYHTWSRARTH